MGNVFAMLVGEVQIVHCVAQERMDDAMQMENVLKVLVIAILDGLVTLVIFEPARAIVPSMASVTMALVCARKASTVSIAQSQLTLNHASVLFSVFEVVCVSATQSIKMKE